MKYYNSYKYQLAEDVSFDTGMYQDIEISTAYFSLNKNGTLYIKQGYAWDGPSGPAIDTPLFIYASLLHDALYQLMRTGKLPFENWREADREMEIFIKAVLRRRLKNLSPIENAKQEIWKWCWNTRLKWIMAGLKWANGRSAHPRNRKKIVEIKT